MTHSVPTRHSADLLDNTLVEIGEGLVHQDDARARRERARKSDALLLAAGQRMWKTVGQMHDADAADNLVGTCRSLTSGLALGAEKNVVAHRQMRKQRVILKRSEEHTSELQSLMRLSYAVFCLK